MEQGFNGADEQEATVSVRHEPEQANTSEAPSLSPVSVVAYEKYLLKPNNYIVDLIFIL